MGASRQSFSLWMDWKYKNFSRVRKNLLIVLFLKRDTWSERKMIVKDSFTTPLNKFIGCKITSHDWHKDSDEDYYVCWKCHKCETMQERMVSKRDEIIDKILK